MSKKVPSKVEVGGRFTIPNFASEYRAWGRDGTRKHVNPAGIRRQFGAVFDPWMMMEIWSKKQPVSCELIKTQLLKNAPDE